ncbi:MAG: vWA domain-containing protein [Armatimonadetes bacterium]|jgi:uncharacterized protein (DUF58 family)|nr:vWA domain-containing protein [Armatimonadota bacterium]
MPAATSSLLEPEFLRKLEQLSIVSKKVFSGQLKGDRRSSRRGTSVEFADFRNYTLGDDLRYVDWNTFARLEKLFLKLFIEEEDLHVYLLLDGSQSMAYGSPAKFDYARRIAASLGYIGLSNLDRVGATVFGEKMRDHLPPVRGKQQVFPYFSFLERAQVGGQTSLAASLKEYALRTRRPGVAILISDFFDPEWEVGLKALLHRRFQVSVIHVLDRSEIRPDLVGDLKLVDCETGEEREITISAGLLKDYQKTVDQFCGGIQETCRRYGADYIQAITDQPFEEMILKWLRRAGLLR